MTENKWLALPHVLMQARDLPGAQPPCGLTEGPGTPCTSADWEISLLREKWSNFWITKTAQACAEWPNNNNNTYILNTGTLGGPGVKTLCTTNAGSIPGREAKILQAAQPIYK